jgi:hypothetical protein
MTIIPFRPEHLSQIKVVQEQQRRNLSYLTAEYLQVLALGPAISAVVDDRIIGCAGISAQFFGMGTLWGMIAQDAGPHFVRLHRAACRLLESTRLRRISASVEVDFQEGCRWLELLGFAREGRMAKYGLDGEDHYLYAWTGARRLLN